MMAPRQLAIRVLVEQRRPDVARRRVVPPLGRLRALPAALTHAGFRWREAEWAEYGRRYRALSWQEQDRLAELERTREAPTDGDWIRWHHELLDQVLVEGYAPSPRMTVPESFTSAAYCQRCGWMPSDIGGKFVACPWCFDPECGLGNEKMAAVEAEDATWRAPGPVPIEWLRRLSRKSD